MSAPESEFRRSSVGSIAPILRIANEIELKQPRIAYLCRFHAFERAHRLLVSSGERDAMRRFKFSLLQRLERDNASSLASRVEDTDIGEIESFYRKYYADYIALLKQGDQADRSQQAKAHQTAGVLFEVLCAVSKRENAGEFAPEIIVSARDVQERTETYAPYNFLPLNSSESSQKIMQLKEVKAAVAALSNIHGLKWPSTFDRYDQQAEDVDLLDWLQAMFGFQRDNVLRQREHLILHLALSHARLHPEPTPQNELDGQAVDNVMLQLFRNYKNWCTCLGQNHNLCFPEGQQETEQQKILYIGLYLLIWGEADNVRYMPQCICYIFHNMAHELQGLLAEDINPFNGAEDEGFFKNVITPICGVIKQAAVEFEIENDLPASWFNYDDLNEHFWSTDCFSLGWPMRDVGSFFKSPHKSRND